MIKIALWIDGVKKFKTKELALKAIHSYYGGLELEDIWENDLRRAEKELNAGATRIVFNRRFKTESHLENKKVIYDEAEINKDIPEDFFDVRRPTIKALILGKIYEFQTREEALDGLRGLIHLATDYDEKNDRDNDEVPFEAERLIWNIELLKKGATRIIDENSEIPEGFYEPIRDESEVHDDSFEKDEDEWIVQDNTDGSNENVVKVVMGRYIKIFSCKEDAIKNITSLYTTLDLAFYKKDEAEIDRVCQELRAGNKRIVFNGHKIPDNFFDERKETIKALILGKIYEFQTREEAIEKLEELIPKIDIFNIELVKKGATRVVDENSEIPEGFYD